MEKLLVRNTTRNAVLADAAEVADTSATRRRGLLGRDSLAPGQGLWIVPCEAVHSFGMRFPIDVVFLNRKHVVCKLREGLFGWRIAGTLRAHSVLELPAGTVKATGTQVGDELDLERE